MHIHISNLIEGCSMNKSLTITILAMTSATLCANVTTSKEIAPLKNTSKTTEAPTKSERGSIGIVNAQEVMMASQIGQAAQQEIKQEQEKAFKRIQEREQEFVKAQKDLESKAKTLSPEAHAKEQKKLVKMQRDGEELIQSIKEEIQMLVYKKTEILDQELLAAAEEFAKLHGFDEVKDKTTGRSLYVAKHLDSSAELTKLLDTKYEAQLAQNSKSAKKASTAA